MNLHVERWPSRRTCRRRAALAPPDGRASATSGLTAALRRCKGLSLRNRGTGDFKAACQNVELVVFVAGVGGEVKNVIPPPAERQPGCPRAAAASLTFHRVDARLATPLCCAGVFTAGVHACARVCLFSRAVFNTLANKSSWLLFSSEENALALIRIE